MLPCTSVLSSAGGSTHLDLPATCNLSPSVTQATSFRALWPFDLALLSLLYCSELLGDGDRATYLCVSTVVCTD